MIAIIDYGLGNLGSIANMLKAIGEKPLVTSDRKTIMSAGKLILPGVGSFDAGMENLKEYGLDEVIRERAETEKVPILGICLGMQLLGKRSQEGALDGLGLIPFENKKFCFERDGRLKVPHMGWDIVQFRKSHPLLEGLHGRQRYYFVHSYYAVCEKEENVLMTCDYGFEFAASVVNGNVMGVQFHPEKSHDYGMALLKNFVEKC